MKQHSMVAEFKNSLKNPCAEELIDLFFYRPLAFIFVKSTMALPLTPNRVSVLAMVAGIAAGISLAGGAGKHFLLGGLLFGLSNVLDCADGVCKCRRSVRARGLYRRDPAGTTSCGSLWPSHRHASAPSRRHTGNVTGLCGVSRIPSGKE